MKTFRLQRPISRHERFICLFWIMLAVIVAQTSFAQTTPNWELKKDENGIKVWVSEVPGSKFKQFKGETTVKATLGSLVTIHQGLASYNKWMYKNKIGEVKSKKDYPMGERGDTISEAYSYIINAFPSPYEDRDIVVHSFVTQNKSTKEVRISLRGLKDYLPARQGLTRIEDLYGYWLFTPVGCDSVKITYVMYTNPSGNVFSWVANMFIVDFPFETLKNLASMLGNPQTSSVRHAGILEPCK